MPNGLPPMSVEDIKQLWKLLGSLESTLHHIEETLEEERDKREQDRKEINEAIAAISASVRALSDQVRTLTEQMLDVQPIAEQYEQTVHEARGAIKLGKFLWIAFLALGTVLGSIAQWVFNHIRLDGSHP